VAIKPIKVSQLNAYIKRILQSDPLLGNVSVSGEISNLKLHGAGNIYFTLKDEISKVSCFLSSEHVRDLHYELSEGLEIVVSGHLYVYERGGSYSIYVKEIAVAGVGNLSLAFEQLKQKLSKEGLFDQSRKRSLPTFPHKIAVVTSDTGAAVQDILKTIKDRNTYVDILIFPCLVQGPGAAADISTAIDKINRLFPEVDIIITGRGGGSMEELWAFNEESVARSISASAIPVISAVGHETDTTIADFVADVRATTPTAAAQLAVPDTFQIKLYLDELLLRCREDFTNKVNYLKMRLKANGFESFRDGLLNRIKLNESKIDQLIEGLTHAIQIKIADFDLIIEMLKIELEGLSPLSIMNRGYGAILDMNGKLMRSAIPLLPKNQINVIMMDGQLICTINDRILKEEKNVGE
jgi:exodeoxyribonuclease VII large subunit